MMGFGFGDGISSLLWGFSMLFSMLLPVIIIVGVVYLVISMLERRKKMSIGKSGAPDPLTILKKRYASGEISKEDFNSMKEDLLTR
ncbi:SHOCT domain-containing protein [Desulfallas sp. Bu1-1]|jgi:putative membrane protein|uniref:SHOCT domain-containing protein n=1 Tax=Desulfallas sp. Bu1-1 TaxID=2787620 RepID=UPI00189DDB54|nr:SHOCT domain-containing protein [Desulfallas sp. Bu1-1]MBF7082322.1 SHOCT domain-containing protein [Desulfallas sp. Bu1-1]